jgi:16S rRNA (guanine(1405)-N(7))-methyltransferase
VERDVDAVVAELRASRKYRHVAAAALTRIARAALRGARDEADAVKRAKRKLHQVFAAFVTSAEIASAERILAALPESPSTEALQAACGEILKRHSSTRERVVASTRERMNEPPRKRGVGVDAGWYAQLWKITGVPSVVLDLGCGFHPFALPWMGLPKDCEYLACDVDERIAALVQRLFDRCGQRGRAAAVDLVVGGAPEPRKHKLADVESLLDVPADVAFLMKLLPTLERQDVSASERLVDTLRAKFLVVTFPDKSLGGRERGMADHYEEFMRTLFERRGNTQFDQAIRVEGDEPTWILRRRPLP